MSTIYKKILIFFIICVSWGLSAILISEWVKKYIEQPPKQIEFVQPPEYKELRVHKEFIILQYGSKENEPINCFRAHNVNFKENGNVEFESDYNRKFVVRGNFVAVEYKMEGDVGLAGKGLTPVAEMMGIDENKCWWGQYGSQQERIR